jgi:hypothetical protein
MQGPKSVYCDDYADLIELVAKFDSGEITRSEFQQRVRRLSNEQLLMVSRILRADSPALVRSTVAVMCRPAEKDQHILNSASEFKSSEKTVAKPQPEPER